MVIDSQPQIIQKTDYLQNDKTGNGFILRSQILVNGKVFNTLPIHNLSDLVHNVTVSYKDHRLKAFKFKSSENRIPFLASKESAPLITFPRLLSSIYQPKTNGHIITIDRDISFWHVNLRGRGKLDMSQGLDYISKELSGESKSIFEYAVITRLLSKGYGPGVFISNTERVFIENFQKLESDEQSKYYENLKTAMANSIS
jgi:hypothetical protein